MYACKIHSHVPHIPMPRQADKEAAQIQMAITLFRFREKMLGFVNPWYMREGYGSRSVCVCVCVSVIMPAATYLVYMMQTTRHQAFYGIFKV